MDKVPNPATWLGRVWDSMPTGQMACLRGLAQTFGLAPSDPRVFDALRAFIVMAARTSEAVRSLSLSADMKAQMLDWETATRLVLPRMVSNSEWMHLRSEFTDVRRTNLRYCELQLAEYCASEVETKTEIDSLLASVAQLQEEIESAAELDSSFKSLLLDVVISLRRALAEYDLRGVQGVDDAIGEIFAFAVRRSDAVVKNTKNPWFKRTFALVAAVLSIGGNLDRGVNLIEKISALLAHNPGG